MPRPSVSVVEGGGRRRGAGRRHRARVRSAHRSVDAESLTGASGPPGRTTRERTRARGRAGRGTGLRGTPTWCPGCAPAGRCRPAASSWLTSRVGCTGGTATVESCRRSSAKTTVSATPVSVRPTGGAAGSSRRRSRPGTPFDDEPFPCPVSPGPPSHRSVRRSTVRAAALSCSGERGSPVRMRRGELPAGRARSARGAARRRSATCFRTPHRSPPLCRCRSCGRAQEVFRLSRVRLQLRDRLPTIPLLATRRSPRDRAPLLPRRRAGWWWHGRTISRRLPRAAPRWSVR